MASDGDVVLLAEDHWEHNDTLEHSKYDLVVEPSTGCSGSSGNSGASEMTTEPIAASGRSSVPRGHHVSQTIQSLMLILFV